MSADAVLVPPSDEVIEILAEHLLENYDDPIQEFCLLDLILPTIH